MYMYDSIEEKIQYKNECKEIIELGESVKRLLDNKDFRLVFNLDSFKEDTVRLCSLFAVHGVNKDDIVKQLTFYAMFNSYIDKTLKSAEVAKSNLEAAIKVDNEEVIGE